MVAEIKSKGNINYTGLLLSTNKTADFVEKNFSSDNPSLVFISAGINHPVDLVKKAFLKAQELLDKPELI